MNRIDRNISIGGVSHAPAGIQNAQIAGIIGLQLDISEKKDGVPLRLAYINRITASAGNGRYIFGGYTAAGNSATPDEKLIQVMRSLMFVKNSLEPGLIGFIWENNSPIVRQNIANAVLNFLRANAYLFPAGLPENEQFQVTLVPPTQTDIDQGLVKIIARCRFNTAIRFVDIDLSFPIPQATA
jgi:phage tail sheath protein FI